MPDDSNWKTPAASPFCEHRVGLLVVERDRVDVEPAEQLARLVDHVEVAQAEEVHLEQPERLDVLHRKLRDDFLVAALLLQWDDVDQRLGADHDACGVNRVGTRQPFERQREVDDLLRDGVVVDCLAQLAARPERVGEQLAGAFGDQLRDLVDDAVGHFEHAARVADGGARGHRRERDDLRDAVGAVLLAHVVDDALAAFDGEVDVDVGHRLAARVQEPLEHQLVADRVDVGNRKRVGDERAGRGAAAGADRDAVLLGEADEVPDDQKVVGEAHLLDRLQLVAEALLELGRDRPVALLQAFFALLDEVVERVAVLGNVEARQVDPAELDLDVAALGDLEGAAHRVVVAGEVERHLGGRLEVEVVGLELPVVGVLERVAGLNAEERLVCARVGVAQVVDVAGRDGREAGLLRELRELGQDARLHVEVRVLQLDVDVVLAERLSRVGRARLRRR